MKKFLITAYIILISSVLPTFGYIKEYFNTFYYDYLTARKIDRKDTENFDFLHKVSNGKIYWLDKSLNSEKGENKALVINLIDEEFHDLKENLDFEAEFVKSCPLSKGQEKKIKKAHKKFMRRLKKCCLN